MIAMSFLGPCPLLSEDNDKERIISSNALLPGANVLMWVCLRRSRGPHTDVLFLCEETLRADTKI